MKAIRVLLLVCLSVTLGLLQVAPGSAAELKDVQWYDFNKTYTGYVPAQASVATKDWLDDHNYSDTEAVLAGISLPERMRSATLLGERFSESNVSLVSVSPDANTMLITVDDALAVLNGSTFQACYNDLLRCSPDREGSWNQPLHLIQNFAEYGVGREGFVWSPDSHYVSIHNSDQIQVSNKNPYSPMLLDVKSGALFTVRTSQINAMFADFIILQTCFDRESKFLYYTSNENKCLMLHRYNIEAKTDEVLNTLPDWYYGCGGMGWTENNELQCVLMGKDRTYSLATFALSSGESWSCSMQSLNDLNPSFLSSCQNSRTILECLVHFDLYNEWYQYLLPQHGMKRIAIHFDNATPYVTLEEPLVTPDQIQNEYQLFQEKIALPTVYATSTSDSTSILLLCMDREPDISHVNYRVFLVDVDTLAVDEVKLPENLPIGFYLYNTSANSHCGGLQLINQDLLLVPNGKGATHLYRIIPGSLQNQ